MSVETVKVKIYNNKKVIKENDFTNYLKACDYARKHAFLGFTAKIQRLVDGKPWAVINIYPPENL